MHETTIQTRLGLGCNIAFHRLVRGKMVARVYPISSSQGEFSIMHIEHNFEADLMALEENEIVLVNNADLREDSNRKCWAVAADFETRLAGALETRFGRKLRRAHEFSAERGHGFIGSQREGSDIFARIPETAPLIVLVTTWQYSHHVAACIARHKGPVLLLANFDGTWPGLVGMLNLAGTLTGLGVTYSRLWSERFDDEFFFNGLDAWLKEGRIEHDLSYLTSITAEHPALSSPDAQQGVAVAKASLRSKEIIGLFDIGCMGMINGLFPMKSMIDIGMPVEILSQSDLLVEMARVPQALREECLAWYEARGMRFDFGNDEKTDLTRNQVLEQCAMMIAVARYAVRFGLTAVGVQYQQGLARCCAASDFAEGAIGSTERFPIPDESGAIIRAGEPIPHANEVDMGSAIPQVLMFRLLSALGMPAETTLHDVRWGSDYEGTFYWDFEISGAVPFGHIKGGIAGATGYRQQPAIFPLGGSTIAGQCKAGRFLWARAFYVGTDVYLDCGTGHAYELPSDEFNRRRNATSPEWPLLNAVLDGVSRDKLMAGHQSNHITVGYVDADRCQETFRAFVAQALTHGMKVRVAGSAASLL